jgi:FixJ family two-component response regulator
MTTRLSNHIRGVRREHFVKGKMIKEITRDLKVSRNTVRKVRAQERPHSNTSAKSNLGRSSGDGCRLLTSFWQQTRPSRPASNRR